MQRHTEIKFQEETTGNKNFQCATFVTRKHTFCHFLFWLVQLSRIQTVDEGAKEHNLNGRTKTHLPAMTLGPMLHSHPEHRFVVTNTWCQIEGITHNCRSASKSESMCSQNSCSTDTGPGVGGMKIRLWISETTACIKSSNS